MSSFFVSHCNYAPELCIANLFKNDKKTNNSLNYFMILMDSKKCFWKVKINHIPPFTGAILEQVPCRGARQPKNFEIYIGTRKVSIFTTWYHKWKPQNFDIYEVAPMVLDF